MKSLEPQTRDAIADTLGLETDRRRLPSPNRLRLWLIGAGLFGLSVLALYFWQHPEPTRYVTHAVQRGDLTISVSATGILAPLKEVQVGIEVSGTIKTVEANYNDNVKIGQILARLDTRRLEAQALQSEAALAAARAKVLQAQASVLETQAQWSRLQQVKDLSGGKVPSRYELDAAKANLARARADQAGAKAAVEQSQAALDVNRTDIGKAVIRSSINGVVLKRWVEPGQTVASMFQSPVLFTLAEDLTQMELQVDVDEADVGLVKEGQHALFTVDAYPERHFPARITQVRYGAQTVDGVVTYKTVLRVDNAELSLRPGMTATAVVTVDTKTDILKVDNAVFGFSPPKTTAAQSGGGLLGALLPRPPAPEKHSEESHLDPQHQTLWTVRDGQLTAIEVRKGASDGRQTEISGEGVHPGLELVADLNQASPE